jgi:hypothetical protein
VCVCVCVCVCDREVGPQHLFINFLCEFLENNLHWVCASECLHTYVKRTNKMHTFFINDLIQLYCLRHVSNNQLSIVSKTVQAALQYFIMHPYRQFSDCQDVFCWLFLQMYNTMHSSQNVKFVYTQLLESQIFYLLYSLPLYFDNVSSKQKPILFAVPSYVLTVTGVGIFLKFC